MVVGDGRLRCDVVHRLVEGVLGRVVDGALHQAHGHLRTIGEFLRQRPSAVHELLAGRDLMHEAQTQRLVGRHDPVAEHEVHGPPHAEVLDEEVVPALVGLIAEAQRGAAEHGVARGDAEVAGQRQRESRLDGEAVDRRHADLVQLADDKLHRLRERPQRAVAVERAAVAVGDVG